MHLWKFRRFIWFLFTSVLLVSLLASPVGVLAIDPNTSLSNANASSLGEADNDWSGYSVAGDGDVNGDGYDDFLIGAAYHSDGGDFAGQTCLILGRGSVWAMDFDLSGADALFIGENASDFSGSSVGGAGDVNGDGYDDFLIGAIYHSERGTQTGQTYLILGTPRRLCLLSLLFLPFRSGAR